MAQPMGNEQNMAKIREAMHKEKLENQAKEIHQGAGAKNIVPIDYVSAEGKEYKGKIQFKRPNVMDIMRIGGAKSEILRTSGVVDMTLVDAYIRLFAEAVATLEVVVEKSPEWFLNITAITDTDLIVHVFRKYQEWEDSFRVKPAPDEAGDSTSSE